MADLAESGYKLAFQIDIPELANLQSVLGVLGKDVGVKTALTTAAIAVQRIARQQAPVRTGRLANSIKYNVNGLTAVIGPTVDYGIYVEMGTGLYGPKGQPIQPKNGKVLATKYNPGWGSKSKAGYFVIGTFSRGQEANPFMSRTAKMALPEVEGIFSMVPLGISKVISEV